MRDEIRTMNSAVTYAQNREDIILSAFFDEDSTGFYVDVGAFDPIEDSVTQYFYERGWHGINIEANKRLYQNFLRHREKDLNLNLAVSNKKGEAVFRDYPDSPGLSTIDAATQDAYEKSTSKGLTAKYKDTSIKVDTLANIFTKHNVSTISFLKIDVEGHEYQVLEGNDWKRFRPEVICIEANHITMDWHGILEKYGYRKIFFDGLNEYFTDHTEPKNERKFRYIEMMIGRSITSYADSQTINGLTADLGKTRASLESIIQKNIKLTEYTTILELTILHNSRFRNQLKGVLVALDNVISVRIENLGRRRYNHLAFSYEAVSRPQDLLKLAHEIDIETFNNGKSSGIYKVLYILLHNPYKLLKVLSKKIIKKLMKIARIIIRFAKGKK
jgi:FkbM family methyltransferase